MSKKHSPKSRRGTPKGPRGSGRASHRGGYHGNSRGSGYAPDAPFSLKDEARNTSSHQSFWTIDTKLRNRSVNFVSAGWHSTLDEEDEQSSTPDQAQMDVEQGPNSDVEVVTAPAQFADLATSSRPQPGPTLTPSPSTANKQSTDFPGPEVSEGVFFIDTIGEKTKAPMPKPLKARSPSPAGSESSEEVVFSGRTTHPHVIDDPIEVRAQESVSSRIESDALVPDKENHRLAVKPAWDDTPDDWVHRSKPGVGWTVPKARKRVVEQPSSLCFTVPKQKQKQVLADDAADDYLANIREYHPYLLQSSAFARRNLDVDLNEVSVQHQFEALSVTESVRVGPSSEVRAHGKSPNMHPIATEDSDIDDSDGPSNEDTDDDGEVEGIEGQFEDDAGLDGMGMTHGIDDETLARLFAKQEELGLGSDKLRLYDDGIDAVVFQAAKQYAKQKPKKPHRAAGSYPQASLAADLLDEDPATAFDLMDMERPSLRKKKKKGKAAAFELSDSEMEAHLQEVWQNDRTKKSLKKQEREELRAQGLIGKGASRGQSIISKYGEGMTVTEIGEEFRLFLASDAQEKSLPPMDKRRRKMVHEIATVFNLKTKSIGKESNRYTKLIKTRDTLDYHEERFARRARQVHLGFFPRTDAGAKRAKKTAGPGRGGGISSAVRYRDGDIVGGAAPEIGLENRGRAMLEKMGWKSGMALGGKDSNGILEPIAHVVKNTKSGLA